MKKHDIQHIWNLARADEAGIKKYTVEDIRKYRSEMSHKTSKSSRLVIIFDIGYKSILAMALIFLLTLNPGHPYQLIISLLIISIILLILLEFHFIRKLKSIKETDSIIENLKNKLKYFTTTHNQFILISAISSPLLVLSGFFFYYLYKYGEIRMTSPADDPVMYLFLIAAFVISYYAQRPMYKIQVRDLKTSLQDMDEGLITSINIEESRKVRRKHLIAISILALIGILVLLILLIM